MMWMDLSASSGEHMRRHSSRRHASQPHMHPPPLRGYALPAVGWGVGRRPRRVGMTRQSGCGAVSGTGRKAAFGVNVRAFHRGAVPYGASDIAVRGARKSNNPRRGMQFLRSTQVTA